MRVPEKILYKGTTVADLEKYGYEFPWASAKATFVDEQIMNKLESLSALDIYDQELEEMELSDEDEESRWEKKRADLMLSREDLELDNDEDWTVIYNDGAEDAVFALSCKDGWLQWRS